MTTRKYKRHSQKEVTAFMKSTFRTVPLSHTSYRGKMKGKAIVGKLKKTGKWAIKTILEEKK
ncbi:MAG: hypothetical protein Q8R37_02635 [Nanoarchaeota archaeon]|nr:hypothetical protein [Nanoarchaeota archaeon]